ncbi:MAG: peptidylprolyl isomerase [Alphaproteobacteria bacterium]
MRRLISGLAGPLFATLFALLPGQYAAAEAGQDLMILELRYGKVVIKLRPDLAPGHVARIKELAASGFYDGHVFHRVIPGFMAQTGDPTGTGRGGSGKNLKAEFTRHARFERGTVGMARSRSPDSADSQFFIMFAPAPHLDGGYTIWGEVIEGMELVDRLAGGQPPANPDRIIRMRPAGNK